MKTWWFWLCFPRYNDEMTETSGVKWQSIRTMHAREKDNKEAYLDIDVHLQLTRAKMNGKTIRAANMNHRYFLPLSIVNHGSKRAWENQIPWWSSSLEFSFSSRDRGLPMQERKRGLHISDREKANRGEIKTLTRILRRQRCACSTHRKLTNVTSMAKGAAPSSSLLARSRTIQQRDLHWIYGRISLASLWARSSLFFFFIRHRAIERAGERARSREKRG